MEVKGKRKKKRSIKNRCICFNITVNLSMMGCDSSKFETETVNSNLKQTQAITESGNDRQVTAGVTEDNEIETQTIEKKHKWKVVLWKVLKNRLLLLRFTISEDKYIYETIQ